MNLPVLMNSDLLVQTRDDLDRIIKLFEKIDKIGNDKMDRIKELIGVEKAQKVMDILFEEAKVE